MNVKVCFAASSGGHFDQLSMLRDLMDKYDSFIVTEKTKYSTTLNDKKTYYLKQVNRKEKIFIFNMIINVINSLRIFLKEKPDVVISTGVLATIPICMIAKIMKKKVIYIESFAIVNKPTMTGKFLYKYADRFYVQWESMKKYYPKAVYEGGVY